MGVFTFLTNLTQAVGDGTITSAKIADGTIVAGDLHAAAGILPTQLAVGIPYERIPFGTVGADWNATGRKISGIFPTKPGTISKVYIRAETMPTCTAADGTGSTIGSGTLDVVKFGTGSMLAAGFVVAGAIRPTTVRKTANAGVAYTDYTSAATDQNAATDVVLDSLDTFANGDWLVVGAARPFAGIVVAMDATNKNDNASILSVEYWNGSAWADITATDGTDVAGDTLKQSGNLTWAVPEDWVANAIDGVTAYHVRVIVSAALDATTQVNELWVIRPAGDLISFTPDQQNTVTAASEIWICCDEADANLADVSGYLINTTTGNA